jgi:hypothetical protein
MIEAPVGDLFCEAKTTTLGSQMSYLVYQTIERNLTGNQGLPVLGMLTCFGDMARTVPWSGDGRSVGTWP